MKKELVAEPQSPKQLLLSGRRTEEGQESGSERAGQDKCLQGTLLLEGIPLTCGWGRSSRLGRPKESWGLEIGEEGAKGEGRT